MKILLVKTSSMGDVIHTLPALTDALQAIPNLEVDWAIEPAFADIASWHPAVKNIILIKTRKWKKNIFSLHNIREFLNDYSRYRNKRYDLVIDAQGLIKSAIIAFLAKGKVYGYNKHSARESFASFFYHEKYAVVKNQNAIVRTRELFSKILHYSLPTTPFNFSIDTKKLPSLDFLLPEKYYVFLHATTWDTKLYPNEYWIDLLKRCEQEGITVYLPWGNETEKNRAEMLAQTSDIAKVLPRLSISQMATVLNNATAIISVDTGFGHLSAALNKKTITLYGPTDAKYLGIPSQNQCLLQADFQCSPCKSRVCIYAKTHKVTIMPPCFETIGPEVVWEKLK